MVDKNYIGLVVSGNPDVQGFSYPDKTELLKLPEITKLLESEYRPRNLPLPLSEVLKLRSEIIWGCLKGFEPDFLIIDNIPNGVLGELTNVIEKASVTFPKTKVILVARDVLDSSEAVISAWEDWNIQSLISRYFSKILVLGERKFFDYETEYQFEESLKGLTNYCGYFSRDLLLKDTSNEMDPFEILVTTGGGIDGEFLISKFIDASKRLKDGLQIVIVMGSQMPLSTFRKLKNRVSNQPNIRVFRFYPGITALMERCKLVIAMGGYNTINEVLALNKKAIIMPRTHPTSEQLIRAIRLEKRGLVKVIMPSELTEERLIGLITQSLEEPQNEVQMSYSSQERIRDALFDLI